MFLVNGFVPLDRRFKLLNIPSELILFLFKSDDYIFKINSKLPSDTKIVNARFDDVRMRFVLILYSESFDDIAENALIPEVSPTDILFRTIEIEQTKEEVQE